MLLKRLVSALTALTLGTLGAVISPTVSSAANHNFLVDCDTIVSGQTFTMAPNDTAVLTIQNCNTPTYIHNLQYFQEDFAASTGDGTYHITAPNFSDTIYFWVTSKLVNIKIRAIRPNPVGSLYQTRTVTMPATYPDFFSVNRDDTGYGQTNIGNDVGCALRSGNHPYSVQEFTISKSGTYTFRTTDLASEIEADGMFNNAAILSQALAIYRGFNSELPDENLVNCESGSASGDGLVDDLSVSGQILNHEHAEVTSTLTPGTYQLLLLSEDNFSSDEWTGGVQTATVEIWGPAGGISIGDELANTGSDLRILWLGLGLFLTGGVLTLRRKF
jgi:hypothetical protein